MKNRSKWAGNVRAAAKIAMCLALAVIMVGMAVTPVLARDGDWNRGRDRNYRHDRPYRHDRYYRPGPGYYPPPRYYAPPPPVVYAPPPPPPGITFVFPLRFD